MADEYVNIGFLDGVEVRVLKSELKQSTPAELYDKYQTTPLRRYSQNS